MHLWKQSPNPGAPCIPVNLWPSTCCMGADMKPGMCNGPRAGTSTQPRCTLHLHIRNMSGPALKLLDILCWKCLACTHGGVHKRRNKLINYINMTAGERGRRCHEHVDSAAIEEPCRQF